MNTPFELVRWAETELKRADIPYAHRDAEALFTDSFGMRREDIYLARDFRLHAQCLKTFRRYVKLRASRYPLQYILKKADFMGLVFLLEEGVFIPRPETEILVERLIEEIKSEGKRRVNVLDIGTGCGNIAISLTKNIAGCKIIASDISASALKVADKNARSHGVKKDIKFVKSGFFDKISSIFYNYFDMIISNPPYVRRRDVEGLQPELSYEDVTALNGGEDGLYFYKRILSDGMRYLRRDGVFIFEIGYDQAEDIARLAKRDNRLQAPELFKDYNGHRRIALVRRRRVGQADYKRR